MREILFRGKSIDDSSWHFGFYVHKKKSMKARGQTITEADFSRDYIIGFRDSALCEVDPETVGQYTRLKDKNGTKIFEGDILKTKFSFEGDKLEAISKVVWFENGWATHEAGFNPDRIAEEEAETSEVIGNIYDNPELLGGE